MAGSSSLRMRLALPLALVAAGLGAHAATASRASVAIAPEKLRCFGAPSHAPFNRCRNPKLDRVVSPTPEQALLMPNAPCTPVPGTYNSKTQPAQCAFGADEATASETVALIGDSHATHWRGALDYVAAKKNWHGVSMTRSGCPLTDAQPVLSKKLREGCTRWNANVRQWFVDRPEVRTVFISQHNVRVRTAPGADQYDTALRGYVSAWRTGLPASVQHIVIIRDTPYTRPSTYDCVTRVIRKKLDPATCAVPRAYALHDDPAAAAAKRFNRRVGLVDFTPFMCDSRRCYEVIGGALVHKDTGHITTVFARTFGPYLLARYDRLVAADQGTTPPPASPPPSEADGTGDTGGTGSG